MALNIALQKFLIKNRKLIILALNLTITAVAFYLALGLRFDFALGDRTTFEYTVFPLLLLLLFRTGAYSYYKLNNGYWRYVSTPEAVSILKAHFMSSLMFATAMGILQFQIPGFPRSFVFIEFTVSLLIATGTRVLVRVWCERNLSRNVAMSVPEKEIVVIGAGVSGHLLIKTVHSQRRLNYRAIAVFDDHPDSIGRTVHGVKIVGSISNLDDFLGKHPHVVAVILANSELPPFQAHDIINACERHHVPVKRLRSFEDIACQEIDEPNTPVTVEAILNREVTIKHEQEIADKLDGKCIMITGAGGSIGSEIVRQVLDYAPSKVILVDKCEYNLYAIQQELAHRSRKNGASSSDSIDKIFLLSDIADRPRLARIFSMHRPQIVIHAAAYKHVPLLESNCYEAFVNNIIGTRNLLRTANDFGAEQFVQISTDKAVDPSSVMGATKRIAEFMVNNVNSFQAYFEPDSDSIKKRNQPMRTSIVRFGNVINSAGSVIPLFKKQILEGGPITVTHPTMERYFMSIREAVRLVLTAGTLGDHGEVYLLDMGKPIKILEVAKKLRALYGRRDIPIEITGVRPGEKLTEVLYSNTEVRTRTRFDKVFVVNATVASRSDVFTWIDFINDEIHDLQDEQIGMLVRDFVNQIPEEIHPQPQPEAFKLDEVVG